MQKKKIEFIQSLRGIACMMVVLFHGSRFISPYGTGLGYSLLGAAGSLGVCLFFIISGFIMVATTQNANIDLKYVMEFFTKRIARIFPTYFIATLSMIILVKYGFSFFSSHENVDWLAKSFIFTPTNKENSPSFGFPVLDIGWTLNYEIYFYLVFGVSILFNKFRWLALYFYLCLSLILIPVLFTGRFSMVSYDTYNFNFGYANLITSPAIWLFIAGSIIGNLYFNFNMRINKKTSTIILVVSLCIMTFQYITKLRTGHGALEWGLSLIPFFFSMCMLCREIKIKFNKSLIFLGEISFSLYLWHPLSQELLPKLTSGTAFHFLSTGIPALIFTTGIAILLGYLSYYVFESILSNKIRNAFCNKLNIATQP